MVAKRADHYEVTCPHCKKSFELTESTYDSIVRSARQSGAEEERMLLEEQYQKDLDKAINLAKEEAKNEHLAEVRSLEQDANTKQTELLGQIKNLEAELKVADKDKKSAVDAQRAEGESAIKLLKQQLKEAETEKRAAVSEAKSELRDEIADLKARLATSEAAERQVRAESETALAKEKEHWQFVLDEKEKQLKKIEEMKLARTTKMVGEDLEQWCKKEFNKVRLSMFPRAEFEKNTKAVEHSMGDFIFREHDDEGDEILSIMFEMKNEQQTPGKKKKNEDFFKELDKDRNNHKCEYAILVSMLEPDNDLYDNIYEVYQYEKMFVVRPEFFITIIVLLRNMALDRFGDRKAMLLHERANVDIANFNNNFEQASIAFGKTVQHAAKQRSEAIKQLEAIKGAVDKALEALRKEEKHFDVSQKKLEALSPSSLSKGNETIKAMFEEFKQHSLPSGDK